jgi:murein DD-endopeptidase MepM/ murein hydrolase activator NlpD
MSRMERRLPLLVLLAVVLLAAAPAASDPGDEKARVDERLDEARDRLEGAEHQEGVLTDELSTLTAQARAAATAAAAEQERLDAVEAELAARQAQRQLIEARLARLISRLSMLRREEAAALDRLELRVREIYMDDDPDAVAVIFGAMSFTDLLDNVELLSRIGRQDKQIAAAVTTARLRTAETTARVRDAHAEALTNEREVAERVAEQRAVRDRLAASRDAAAVAETAKEAALGEIRETESALAEEIEALEAESAALAATIRAAGSVSTGAPSASGLVWPVSGPVTSGFGPRWGRMHEGIDIAVPEGTSVGAAAAGVVIYAGWLGGYGNLVVVDHGDGLSTAYAHNSGFAVSVGSNVSQGEVIAYSGNTGNSSGPHVHFEVRVNGGAVDPLGYL